MRNTERRPANFCVYAILAGALSGVASPAVAQGSDVLARSIADQIIIVSRIDKTLAPCKQIPVYILYQAKSATTLFLRAARAGSSPIEIDVEPAVPLSRLPPPVADMLNRVQEGGGTVTLVEKRPNQSVGAVLAYVASMASSALSAAVDKLLGAMVSEWAADGLRRYSALVYYHPTNTVDVVDDIKLVCGE